MIALTHYPIIRTIADIIVEISRARRLTHIPIRDIGILRHEIENRSGGREHMDADARRRIIYRRWWPELAKGVRRDMLAKRLFIPSQVS